MAANFKIVDPGIGNQPVTLTQTVKQFPLGLEVQAIDMATGSAATGSGNLGCARFVYCVGSAASGASRGDLVFRFGNSIQKAGPASTATMADLGIAAGDVSNSNVYGWVQIGGICDYAKMENATTDTYLANGVAATAFVGSASDGCMNTTQTAAGHAIMGVGFPYGSVVLSGASSVWSTASFSNMTVQLFRPRMGMTSAL
jgi:hypothetical protein